MENIVFRSLFEFKAEKYPPSPTGQRPSRRQNTKQEGIRHIIRKVEDFVKDFTPPIPYIFE